MTERKMCCSALILSSVIPLRILSWESLMLISVQELDSQLHAYCPPGHCHLHRFVSSSWSANTVPYGHVPLLLLTLTVVFRGTLILFWITFILVCSMTLFWMTSQINTSVFHWRRYFLKVLSNEQNLRKCLFGKEMLDQISVQQMAI